MFVNRRQWSAASTMAGRQTRGIKRGSEVQSSVAHYDMRGQGFHAPGAEVADIGGQQVDVKSGLASSTGSESKKRARVLASVGRPVGKVIGDGIPPSASPAPAGIPPKAGVETGSSACSRSIGRFPSRLLTEGEPPGLVKTLPGAAPKTFHFYTLWVIHCWY